MCVNAIHRHNRDTCVTCDTCVYVKQLKRRQSIYTCVNANYLKTRTKYTHTCVYANYSKSLVSMLYHSKTRVSMPTIKRHTKYIHVCLCQPFKDICQSTYTCVHTKTNTKYIHFCLCHPFKVTCVYANHSNRLTKYTHLCPCQSCKETHRYIFVYVNHSKTRENTYNSVYTITSKTSTKYTYLCLCHLFKDTHKLHILVSTATIQRHSQRIYTCGLCQPLKVTSKYTH